MHFIISHQDLERGFILNWRLNSACRGYQRIGENITKGVPDIHEAIDVGIFDCCFTKYKC